MTCKEFADFLMDYFSGTLPEADERAFARHLSVCKTCVAYLKNYEETVLMGKAAFDQAAGSNLPDEVPEELVRAILAVRRL